MLLSGCGGSSSADAPAQTPFDLLKNRVSTAESKVSQIEADLEDVDLDNLETIGSSFNSLKAQFDALVLAFGVLQESLDDLTDALAALALQVDDIEQSGNETATGLASLIITLADLTSRVEQLEQDEPEEESALALTIVGSLPSIVKASETATFSIYVRNKGTSATSGQIVLQLYAQGDAVDVTSAFTDGIFSFGVANFSPSQTTCTKITFISIPITLTSGQSKAYTFTLTLEQVDAHWWIPTLEIAD